MTCYSVTRIYNVRSSNMELTTETKTGPAWGYRLNYSVIGGAIWGARAIYERNSRATGRTLTNGKPRRRWFVPAFSISTLWDRQEMVGGTDTERQALAKWLDKEGMKQLTDLCDSEYLEPNENRLVMVFGEDYIIQANPQKSYGYLYITAYARAGLRQTLSITQDV